jgi:hypothetical protein
MCGEVPWGGSMVRLCVAEHSAVMVLLRRNMYYKIGKMYKNKSYKFLLIGRVKCSGCYNSLHMKHINIDANGCYVKCRGRLKIVGKAHGFDNSNSTICGYGINKPIFEEMEE